MKYNVNFFGTQQVIRLGPVTEVWKVLLYTMGSLKMLSRYAITQGGCFLSQINGPI